MAGDAFFFKYYYNLQNELTLI